MIAVKDFYMLEFIHENIILASEHESCKNTHKNVLVYT